MPLRVTHHSTARPAKIAAKDQARKGRSGGYLAKDQNSRLSTFVYA